MIGSSTSKKRKEDVKEKYKNMEDEIIWIIRFNLDYYVMIRNLDDQHQQALDEAIAKSAEEITNLIKK